jgi:hypothetical protein
LLLWRMWVMLFAHFAHKSETRVIVSMDVAELRNPLGLCNTESFLTSSI